MVKKPIPGHPGFYVNDNGAVRRNSWTKLVAN